MKGSGVQERKKRREAKVTTHLKYNYLYLLGCMILFMFYTLQIQSYLSSALKFLGILS